jgi:hypothetical protein
MREYRKLSYTNPDDAVHEKTRAEMDQILSSPILDAKAKTMALAAAMARGQRRLSPRTRVEHHPTAWDQFICLLIGWRTARDTGSNVYQVHRRSGHRRVWHRDGWGYQPIDQHWLDTGEWSSPGVEPINPWPRR